MLFFVSAPRAARATFTQRLSSTLSYSSKPLPPKSHLHASIPSSTFPQGYAVTGVHAGVKKKADVLDVGVLLSTSPHPTSAAACFTRNAFQAAPVLVSQEVLANTGGRARALVVNSGCANAVTGRQGLEDAWAMVRETDRLLEPAPTETNETLVMSTGVIGQNLPIVKIISAIQAQKTTPSLGSDFLAWERLAKAFMTTDTFPKLRARTFTIGGKEFRIAGIDKGAGMIHPDMAPAAPTGRALHATLLGCIATDAAVSPTSLQSALAYAVDRSFNAISVDGDMSTNDTVLLLANGAAYSPEEEVMEIDENTDKAAYVAFRDELTAFAAELAQLVVRDGEGATKFVTVTVEVRFNNRLSVQDLIALRRVRRPTLMHIRSRLESPHRLL
jgi:glutamate N-acetyltransferase / amino-acid N-acetyltransferase